MLYFVILQNIILYCILLYYETWKGFLKIFRIYLLILLKINYWYLYCKYLITDKFINNPSQGVHFAEHNPKGQSAIFKIAPFPLHYWPGPEHPFLMHDSCELLTLFNSQTLWIVQKRKPLSFPHIHPLLVNMLACLDVSRLAKSGGVAAYQNE